MSEFQAHAQGLERRDFYLESQGPMQKLRAMSLISQNPHLSRTNR